jgi:hypothetical protein
MMLKHVALAVLLALSSCSVLKDIVWPTTVKCLTTPAAGLVEKVQKIVEADGLGNVFSPATVDALEDVARTYGPEVVVCILKELIDAYTAPTGMQAPPDRLAAARRTQDFLNEHDIVVVGSEE